MWFHTVLLQGEPSFPMIVYVPSQDLAFYHTADAHVWITVETSVETTMKPLRNQNLA